MQSNLRYKGLIQIQRLYVDFKNANDCDIPKNIQKKFQISLRETERNTNNRTKCL